MGKARWSERQVGEKVPREAMDQQPGPGNKHLLFLQVYKGISLHFTPGSQELIESERGISELVTNPNGIDTNLL